MRYFLGLADNTRPYSNLYEFRSDRTPRSTPCFSSAPSSKPNDPNLHRSPGVASRRVREGSTIRTSSTTRTVARERPDRSLANWRKVASPVLTGPRLDLLAWRKDGSGELMPDLPSADARAVRAGVGAGRHDQAGLPDGGQRRGAGRAADALHDPVRAVDPAVFADLFPLDDQYGQRRRDQVHVRRSIRRRSSYSVTTNWRDGFPDDQLAISTPPTCASSGTVSSSRPRV